MINQERDKIEIGATVEIVKKEDQPTGTLTRGTVARILTKSQFHPHGIKVELSNGQIGRIKNVIN
ncbi:MAG: hypothetical protein BWY15_02016 [Firmicutes bacterium ADurb.Bin193]|nr:MAG: hypothetical protein BWY15_02016 [Firmicutes bacterium ADurb.Bin193]